MTRRRQHLLVGLGLLRAWRRRRLSAAAGLAGVVAGVTLITLVVGIVGSISHAIRGGTATGLFHANVVATARSASGMDDRLASALGHAVAPAPTLAVIYVATRLDARGDGVLALLGVRGDAGRFIGGLPAAPRLGPRDGRRLLLGREWAERHGLHVGSAIRLASSFGTSRWVVGGLITGDVPNGGAIALANLPAVRAVSTRPHAVDDLYVKTAVHDEVAVAARMRATGRGGVVAGPLSVTARADQASLRTLRGVLLAVAAIAVLAALGTLAVSWRLLIEHELPTLSRFLLVGATARDLLAGCLLVLGAATILCSLLGVAGGILLSRAVTGVSQQLAGFSGLAAVSSPSGIVQPALAGAATGVGLALVAALAVIRPLRDATPMEAFREVRDRAGRRRVPAAAGTVGALLLAAALGVTAAVPPHAALAPLTLALAGALLLAAATPALAGRALVGAAAGWRSTVVGRALGAEARRMGGLAALLLVAAVTALGLLGVILSFQHAMARSVASWTKADLFVRQGWGGETLRDARFPPSVQQDLAHIPGVRTAGAWTFDSFEWGGRRVMLQAYDAEHVAGIVELIVYKGSRGPTFWAALRHGGVAVSESLARLRGYRPGDTLVLPTAHGSARVRVVAVVDDYISDNGAVIASLDTYRRLTGDDRIDSVPLALAPGADRAAVEAAVRERLSGYVTLLLATGAQMRAHVLRFFDAVLAVLAGFAAVVVAIVLLVILVVTTAMLRAREAEIAVLHVVGLERRRIRTALVGESSLLAAAAWTLALPVSYVVVRVGLDLMSLQTGLLPPTRISVWAVLALLPVLVGLTVASVWRSVTRAAATPIRHL